ncbi:hypothetical protein [Desulfobacula toluolica]|uniref:Conserved uncharacterized protein n=1 Tax=Desulfobacula toluolica (strain DSM 7467 / Tol2) TaxID=651182 RepID=K0N9Q2_DESTT|nr:hypothetical protein [Desulfobacula toluolica]CCK80694.1 conserved uncharacterized protein [Desulfobacula toluolica Tol2]
MTFLQGKKGYLLSLNTPATDEADALQADVMRFMAILGFCLLVIFSLVQTLPVQKSDPRPDLVSTETLTNQIKALKNEIMDLKQKTQAIASIAVTIHKDLTKQKQIIQRIDDSKQELKKSEARLNSLKLEIRENQRALSMIQQDADKEKQNLDKIKAELDKIKQSLSQSDEKPSDNEVSDVESDTKEVGFSLHFKNDETLTRLVRQKKVTFYGIAGKKAWKVLYVKGTPVFKLTPIPTKYYEMMPSTVPSLFSMAFSRNVAAFGDHTVKWGVTLPESVGKQIAGIMENHKNGDMVIDDAGGVLLERIQK